jgi:hypothetical protein
LDEKYTILIDFDGVVHDYRYGWDQGRIRGEVVPGFFKWAYAASQKFLLAIYSTRSKAPDQLEAMMGFMVHGFLVHARREDWSWWVETATTKVPGLSYLCPMHRFRFQDLRRPPAPDHRDKFDIVYVAEKPISFLTIDDRAVQFQGDWADPALNPEALAAFKPWNQR